MDPATRAQELLAAGDPQRAKALLRQALAHQPEALPLWDLLGQAYHALADPSTAAQCWLRSGRDDAPARQAIVRLLRGWGRWRSWRSLNRVYRCSEQAPLERWRRLLRLQTEEGDAFVRALERSPRLRGCGVLTFLAGAVVLAIYFWKQAGPLILLPAAGMPVVGYLQGLYHERRRTRTAQERYERLHREREERLAALLKESADDDE